jgi:cytoskeletal protein CcmA (bactofilin family)
MYLLIFILMLVLAGAVIVIAYQQNKNSSTEKLKTQGLSQKTLDQLANGDVTVGDNQTVLNVRSSAVFAGQVLVRKDLEVAGNLRIGGTVALNNITIAGTSQLGQVTVNKDLAVAGNTSMQGTATVGKSLQVGGGGTFSGPLSAPQITASTLQLNGDLVLTHHITTGGSQPSRSGGSALGSGGSVSLSGSDTAGSVNINTGSGPGAGCFVTVNFANKFNSTPHVQVTPVGSAAGGLSYYVNRSTTNFSICVASPPPPGSSFGFDYFVVS